MYFCKFVAKWQYYQTATPQIFIALYTSTAVFGNISLTIPIIIIFQLLSVCKQYPIWFDFILIWILMKLNLYIFVCFCIFHSGIACSDTLFFYQWFYFLLHNKISFSSQFAYCILTHRTFKVLFCQNISIFMNSAHLVANH